MFSGVPSWQPKAEELDHIIAEEGLNPAATEAFIADAFRDGAVPTTGMSITNVLPPVSRFTKGGGHGAKKMTVLSKLTEFFERYIRLARHITSRLSGTTAVFADRQVSITQAR